MGLKLFFKGAWQKWKKIANVIAFYNTKFLVSLLFFTVIMVYGLSSRLFKIDIIDIKIRKDAKSYWKKVETKNNDCSKQY